MRLFGYDLVGNLVYNRNARGEETYFQFDVLDRLDFVDRPAGEKDVDLTYDDSPAGGSRRRASVTELEGGYLAGYSYDELGRLARQSLQVPVDGALYGPMIADFEYDLLGRPTRIAYPDQGTNVVYFYEGDYLVAVCNEAASGGGCASDETQFLKDVQYDTRGRPVLLDLYPGDLAYSYEDVEQRLSKIRYARNSGTEDLELTYGYDRVGNVTSVTDLRNNQGDGIIATATYGYL